MLQCGANETLDILLDGRVKIIQPRDGYRVNEDSLRLCRFVRPMPGAEGIDLGAGCGILSIILTLEDKVKSMVAIELQEPMADLARRNAALNELGGHGGRRTAAGLANRAFSGGGEESKGEGGRPGSSEQIGSQGGIEVLQGDIRQVEELFEPRSFSLAVSNPPYRAADRGRPSPSAEKNIARREQECSMEDLARAAAYLLKPKGILDFCHLKERWEEIAETLAASNFVVSRREEEGDIVLVEAVAP